MLKFIDDALGELNDMDSMISSYKVHLNVSVVIVLSVLHPLERSV